MLRRREVVPHLNLMTSRFPRFAGFEMEPVEVIRDIIANTRGYGNAHAEIHRSAIAQCHRAYGRIYKELHLRREQSSPPCLVSVFSNKAFASGMYSLLIRQNDDKLPLALHLGIIVSAVASASSFIPKVVIYVWGCEFSSIVAAAHGSDQTSQKGVQYAPFRPTSPTSTSTENTVNACPLSPEMHHYIGRVGKSPKFRLPANGRKDIDVLIVSAENIAKLNHQTLQLLADSVKHRILVYGTSLVSVDKFHEILTSPSMNSRGKRFAHGGSDVFELKMNLVENCGVAMWERKNSVKMLYAPHAKEKYYSAK